MDFLKTLKILGLCALRSEGSFQIILVYNCFRADSMRENARFRSKSTENPLFHSNFRNLTDLQSFLRQANLTKNSGFPPK